MFRRMQPRLASFVVVVKVAWVRRLADPPSLLPLPTPPSPICPPRRKRRTGSSHRPAQPGSPQTSKRTRKEWEHTTVEPTTSAKKKICKSWRTVLRMSRCAGCGGPAGLVGSQLELPVAGPKGKEVAWGRRRRGQAPHLHSSSFTSQSPASQSPAGGWLWRLPCPRQPLNALFLCAGAAGGADAAGERAAHAPGAVQRPAQPEAERQRKPGQRPRLAVGLREGRCSD